MRSVTVTTAYGREYTTAAQAEAHWADGKDFILRDPTSQWDGAYMNREDAVRAGIQEVNIRYARNTKVVVVKVST